MRSGGAGDREESEDNDSNEDSDSNADSGSSEAGAEPTLAEMCRRGSKRALEVAMSLECVASVR